MVGRLLQGRTLYVCLDLATLVQVFTLDDLKHCREAVQQDRCAVAASHAANQ